MDLNLDTWIISDTHFFHDNIVKYCNRPEDHTERIAKAWRSMILPSDTVLHLGDLFMGINRNDPNLTFLLASLTGRKYLIMGNHDRQKERFYSDFGYTVVEPFTMILSDGLKIRFSHYPEACINTKADLDWNVDIHGHIHNNGYGSEILVPGRKYINVSIEETDYKPIRLKDILKKAGV